MILISFTLALIAIVFGAKLLAQFQKESLGALYKYLAWFVIVMGFLVLMCDVAHSLMRMCHRGDANRMNTEYMMMNGDGNGMMGGNCPMMMHHGDMRHEGGMMNCGGNSNCCMHGGDMCHDGGMMNCKDDGKGGASCNEGGGMSGGSCSMMGNMKDKKDSAKAKK
jgi:hypothetical protein